MSQSLPPCFRPNAECQEVLERVRDGFAVDYENALRYMHVGFIAPVSTPTSRSGYELTSLGQEALDRVQPREHKALLPMDHLPHTNC